MVEGVPTRFGHEVERRGAAARAALLRSELETTPAEELRRSDPGRAMILPLLMREHRLTNLDTDDPLVFGRLDGRAVPPRHIKVVELAENWQRVVLASDGYPMLAPTFEATEQLLAQRIHLDPLMIAEPPATKGVAPGQVSFDDRTWLEIAR
jgi:glycerophosphoryl diester phosphodiesterase